MSANIAYFGGIVVDGLILCMDSAKVDSYPGFGTTWNSIARGQAISGSLINGVSYSSVSRSFSFDGSNDYVQISDSDVLRPQNVTAGIWARKSTTTQVQSILFTKRYVAAVSPFNSYCISQNTSPTYDKRYIMSIGTSVTQYEFFSPQVNDTLWHHVVMTYDGSNITGYLDGTNVGTLSAPGPIVYSNLTLNIAGSANWGGTNAYKGNLNCFHIYNRALSATEVLQNYNALKGRFGL